MKIVGGGPAPLKERLTLKECFLRQRLLRPWRSSRKSDHGYYQEQRECEHQFYLTVNFC